MGIPHEEEKDVAVYTLREGEEIRVRELTQFGVEPFGVKLVRATSSDTNLPSVISNAKSIELVTIQANLSTLPSYRLALRNVSSKNVSAIGLEVMIRSRRLIKTSRLRWRYSKMVPLKAMSTRPLVSGAL